MYLFGGWDGKNYLANVYEYNPDLDAWERKTDMPTARAFAGAAPIDGKIYVVGGYDGSKPLGVSEVYSPELDIQKQNSWEKSASFEGAVYRMGVSSLAESLFLIGGVGPNSGTAIPFLEFNQRLNQWQSFNSLLDISASSFSFVSYGNDILMLGGRVNGQISPIVRSYRVFYTISVPLVH